MTRPTLVIAGLAIPWALLHGADLLGPLHNATFLLLGTVAVTATIMAVRVHRPRVRWPWWCIAAALVLFLVGGALRVVFGTLGDLSADRSLLPDMVTLPGYMLLGAGMLGIARTQREPDSVDLDTILDGLVAALAALALAWVFLVNPVLFHENAPLPVRILLASYPPMSVFIVAITARIAFSATNERTPAHYALFAVMSFLVAGDVLYMIADAGLADLPRSLVDLPYALAYALTAAAVVHPSMASLTNPDRVHETAPTRPRLVFVAGALAVPTIVTIVHHEALVADRIALAVIILSLTATAIWRVFRALHAHARAQARLAHQATHDVLTGLPNRIQAQAHLAEVLRTNHDLSRGPAILFLDVDRFKLINETFGHEFGDQLLVAIARRLEHNTEPDDFVGRIGSDEFVVIMAKPVSSKQAAVHAERLRLTFHVPFTIGESEIYASASIGIAVHNDAREATEPEALIRDADTAAYQAKLAGRDGVAVFDPAMRGQAAERVALERDLRLAQARDQLSLFYQPILDAPTGAITGVEALLRWTHPVLGDMPREKFVPIAEESGLIMEIGDWVIHEACRQLAYWRRHVSVAEDLYVAINLSMRQLRDPRLLETIASAIAEHDLPADALHLELTESLLMDNPIASAEVLGTLRVLGVGLSIDDFGTGYSSLAHLKRFPVTEVKIDRGFVIGLDDEDSSDETLVSAIVAMAGALGMRTVAEGVETEHQMDRVRRLGCDLIQGHFHSRPVTAEKLPEVLLRLSGVTSDEVVRRIG